MFVPRDHQAKLRTFNLPRFVRDCISDITPFSPIAGIFAAARVVALGGMDGEYALA